MWLTPLMMVVRIPENFVRAEDKKSRIGWVIYETTHGSELAWNNSI
jgi:hypothetical protein